MADQDKGVRKLDQNNHTRVVQRVKGNVLNSFKKKFSQKRTVFYNDISLLKFNF